MSFEAILQGFHPRYSAFLRALYTGAVVFGVTSLFEIWMDLGRAHGLWVLADNAAAGITTGLIVFFYERWEGRRIDALRRSEEKFSKAFRQGPMAVTLTSAQDHHYLDVNKTFERLTGWRRDEVLGKTPFDIHLWADPNLRHDAVRRILAEGSIHDLEARCVRKDGSEIFVLCAAELIEIEGETCVLGVIADITDRKQAQEAAANFGRRLLQAQEEERRRIARELHDNINQKIALTSMELDILGSHSSDLTAGTKDRVHAIQQRLLQIGKEIQGLSHHLHSSKLEVLGFLNAAKSFCREVSDLQGVEIEFTHSNFPDRLSPDVSTCFYRVLQEAVQNAVKHSGMRRLSVALRANPLDVQMEISDAGVGFNAKSRQDHGLGLISMEERLHLVGGELSIDSQPGRGTTVKACVPI